MYIRSLFFSALALSGVALQAAPQPETITNEIDAEAGELRISIEGQNFGPGPEVLFFHDFRGLEDGVSLKETEPKVGEMSFGTSNPEVGTYLEQKGFWVINEKEDDDRVILRSHLGGQYKDVFLAYSVAVPEGRTTPSQTELKEWGGSTWKFSWLLQEEGANSNGSQFDIVLPQQNGDNATIHGNSSKFNRVGSGAAFPFANMSEWWSWGKYSHISGWLSADEDNASKSTAVLNIVNDEFGMLHRDNNSLDEELEFSGPSISVSQVNFPGWVRDTEEDNFQAIYTNLYVAGGPNMLARVELTDSENYVTSGYRKVLVPEDWTENGIITNVSLGAFKRQGSLYVHVFNALGERATSGLLACQKCPVMTPIQ